MVRAGHIEEQWPGDAAWDGAGGRGRMRCWPHASPGPERRAYDCPRRLRASSSSPRKARDSSPASSNAGCDTHHHYITVPSALRRRLGGQKAEGEEEGSRTGSRSAPRLQPLLGARLWRAGAGPERQQPAPAAGPACRPPRHSHLPAPLPDHKYQSAWGQRAPGAAARSLGNIALRSPPPPPLPLPAPHAASSE